MRIEESKNKFVKYLTEGIDIHIPNDEVDMFYDFVTKFINEADNDFEAYFIREDEKVLICDKYFDYLKFNYKNNKIVFEHAVAGSDYDRDPEYILKMGLAFVGVLVFIESLAPSEDSTIIFPEHYDKWKL